MTQEKNSNEKALNSPTSMLSLQDRIGRARRLVRRGNFVEVATDKALIDGLIALMDGPDTEAALLWRSGRSILAEAFDQTGQYTKAAALFEYSTGDSMLVELEEAITAMKKPRRPSNKNPDPSDVSNRRLLRARALFTLQAAISLHRQHKLSSSLHLLIQCKKALDDASTGTFRFHGVLSLIHYWLGRVFMLRGEGIKAREHFRESITQTEENLLFHFPRPLSPEDQDDERIAVAVYNLGSCMAFGLAELNFLAGRLSEASTLLQPAVAMLMGTGDNYRCGSALLLVGKVARARSGLDASELAVAIKILERARDLFSEKSNNGLAHSLYEAEADYQIAVAHLYAAQGYNSLPRRAAPTLHMKALKAATVHLTRAEKCVDLRTKTGNASFKNDELKSKMLVLRSRILREQRSYPEALSAANGAIKTMSMRTDDELYFADAYIARGEVILGECMDICNSNPKMSLLEQAKNDFAKARKLCKGSITMNAVTGLHMARVLAQLGDTQQSRYYFHQNWERIETRIENGWIRQFAKKVKDELYPCDVLTIDLNEIRNELEDGKKLFKVVEGKVHGFLLDYAKTSGKRKKSTIQEQAVLLGMTEPTFREWRRKHDRFLSLDATEPDSDLDK